MQISRLWNATAAVAGILFVIVLAFGVIAALSPYADIDPTSSSEAIAEALIDGGETLFTGNYVLMMSAFLLVVFAGYLRDAISPAEVRAWPATVGFGGALLAAALLTIVALIGISQAQMDTFGTDTVVAKTLLVLSWGSVSMVIPGLAAFTFGMSMMSLVYKTLPRWVGWLGAIATLFVLTFWVLGVMVALVWIAVVSVILTIREVRAEEAPEIEPAAD